MISSKFGIGQQVRHRLSGTLGVVVDVDAEFSLSQPEAEAPAMIFPEKRPGITW